jgi:transposase
MQDLKDSTRATTAFDQHSTLVVVVELAQTSWLVRGLVPAVHRQPLKKIAPSADALAELLEQWTTAGRAAGATMRRTVVAFEAGRDGAWLGRWLLAHGIEAWMIHAASIPVSREQRRAKTDRLDTELLQRALLGWLRGERGHCRMAAIPSLADEDARTTSRERDRLVEERTRLINRIRSTMVRLGIRGFKPAGRRASAQLAHLRTGCGQPLPPETRATLERDLIRLTLVRTQIKTLEAARVQRLATTGDRAAVATRHLARLKGLGIETADTLMTELFCRSFAGRRQIARYCGLTGSPDESGRRRREQGLARGGNRRVRHVLIQLAWRVLLHQKDCALSAWFRMRTAGGRP